MNESGVVLSRTSSDFAYGQTRVTYNPDVTGSGPVDPTSALATDPYQGYEAQHGYYLDSETGLYLCTFRHYDPLYGRWLTRDPIGYAGGINLFARTTPSTMRTRTGRMPRTCRAKLKRFCPVPPTSRGHR